MLRSSATFDSVIAMDHIAIIDKLGGPKVLASEMTGRGVRVEPVTVRSWRLKGRMIPAKYWAHIAEIAAEKGVAVSFGSLAEAVAATPTQERAA